MSSGILSHPQLSSAFRVRIITTLSLLRGVFLVLTIAALDNLLGLGTSLWLLSGCAVLGVTAGSRLAFSRLTSLAMLLALAVAWFFAQTVGAGSALLPHDTLNTVFRSYVFGEHLSLCALTFGIGFLSSWFFWRLRYGPIFESLALIFAGIYLVSGHRNYRLDFPKWSNSLAWELGLEPLTMVTVLGAGLVALVLCYLILSHFPGRPFAGKTAHIPENVPTRGKALSWALSLSAIAALTYGLSHFVYQHYYTGALTRVSNGVGQDAQEGMSPLGFHSALGSTSQPAAMVRLEGDYSQNPFSPMLYMRESALSEFNGHELVLAPNKYDLDITRTNPREAYTGKENPDFGFRTPVVQSIYLLADQQSAFAIDYPLSIVQLKNPNPGRFKATYRAYSVAPSFAMTDLPSFSVGDPSWDEETRSHYLKLHPDPRYSEFAKKLTADAEDSPLQKAFTILQYLSTNTIYTLTPNHDVAPADDPVAPYLFGDMRGYCVHFAHATVYMFRALGIPSRIGTGYMTDLSQAKDGHILLRLSDRHAWAEVFITGIGWVPFDIRPQQVESHADTQVDMKLLEELMGMLDPGEEILPPEASKDEPALAPEERFTLPEWRTLALALAPLLLLLLGVKLYLRYGWLLTRNPQRRTVRRYRAIISQLADAGIRRIPAETRTEFSSRLKSLHDMQTGPATDLLLQSLYRSQNMPQPALGTLDTALSDTQRNVRQKLPWHRRLLAVLNPVATLRFLTRGSW